MSKTVEQRGNRLVRNRFQLHAEQTASTGEIAFPDSVARVVLQRGVQNACDIGAALQLTCERQGSLLMTFQAHSQSAQTSQGQKTIITAYVEPT